MTFIIDGYNLMHAIGLATKTMTAKAFERNRLRFLEWLAESTQGRAVQVRTIFDAQSAQRGSKPLRQHGMEVEFTVGQSADDRIAELIATVNRPEMHVVVSNDRQVREAARRGGCRIFACEEFVDWLQRIEPAGPDRNSEPEKPEPTATAEEMAVWLAAFSRPRRR